MDISIASLAAAAVLFAHSYTKKRLDDVTYSYVALTSQTKIDTQTSSLNNCASRIIGREVVDRWLAGWLDVGGLTSATGLHG